MDDADLALANELAKPLSGSALLRVLARALLKHGDDAGFTLTRALADELRGKHTLAGAGRPGEQHRVAGRNATAEHVVQSLDAEREPFSGRELRACHCRPRPRRRTDDHPREDLHAVVRDPEGMQPGNRSLAPHLHHLHLANHRVPIEALIEP